MHYAVLLLVSFDTDTALVQGLGADPYSERAVAQRLLVQRGWYANRALRRGLISDDVEVRRACRVLLGLCAADGVRAEFGHVPEIDSAWYDAWPEQGRPDYRTRLYPIEYARLSPYLDIVGRDEWPYSNYYAATRLWLEQELAAGVDPESLRPRLVEMSRRDRVFLGRQSIPMALMSYAAED